MSVFEAKLTSKGQITLPVRMRDDLHLDAGDRVIFTQDDDGSYRIAAKNGSLASLKGIVRDGGTLTSSDIAGWIRDARGRATPQPQRRRTRVK